MTTYTWSYPALTIAYDADGKTNVVTTVAYRLTADNGSGAIVSAGGNYDPPPPEKDFIPFEKLTEADVQGWTEANVDVKEVQSRLDAEIEAIEKAPTGVVLPPWIGQPTPVEPVEPDPNTGNDSLMAISEAPGSAPDVIG
ncbi:hypothetical protein UFOVP1288_49 [uncultured Caudovirales phage]|uniref:DUF7936 domain-containing protein n=1 Tax=uncultured Caudovirales phage TaxID=2100421 RepID=A0A6J5RF62_9CAUD|nr:hypothetical protein UFOVP1195_49 [uncultured Caudovirales phage]CAB4195938.1 hypothetical protein UFOVP1288_49 [uncultured Caudovirales phage]CAB4205083.1 hypothetical protein UFOVP1409_49 [uncultured Caudovirales phage]